MVAWEFPPAFVRCLSSQWSNKGLARVSLNLKHLLETLIVFVGGILAELLHAPRPPRQGGSFPLLRRRYFHCRSLNLRLGTIYGAANKLVLLSSTVAKRWTQFLFVLLVFRLEL